MSSEEPMLMIVGGTKKRGGARPGAGRKPSPEPHERMSTWVPVSLCERAIQVANAREITLSKLICDAVAIALESDQTPRRVG